MGWIAFSYLDAGRSGKTIPICSVEQYHPIAESRKFTILEIRA
jgi:hypothetical protein